MNILRFAPRPIQLFLKRSRYSIQIRRKTFVSPEPEFKILESLLKPGDFAVDVGANVGHYALRMSELVGTAGGVLAFEPIPDTFKILKANLAHSNFDNYDLRNFAVSDKTGDVEMSVPRYENGLMNFYRAAVVKDSGAAQKIPCVTLDSLGIKRKIALVKIDVESHELFVLRGMAKLLERDHPTLIIENGTEGIIQFLQPFGYAHIQKLAGSPNLLLETPGSLQK